jgi:hypothetical protein
MAISRVGSATGVNSATLPAHQAGDLIIAVAFRDGSITSPSLPAGWTNISAAGLNSCSLRAAYKIAASGSEVSGTWTNATNLIVVVYRGVHNAAPIGTVNTDFDASTAVRFNTLAAFAIGDGSSWVLGAAGHRSVDTSLENAPTGMSNVTGRVDAVCEIALHDTNAGVSSWPTRSVSVGGTSSGWRSVTIEIKAATATPQPARSMAIARMRQG